MLGLLPPSGGDRPGDPERQLHDQAALRRRDRDDELVGDGRLVRRRAARQRAQGHFQHAGSEGAGRAHHRDHQLRGRDPFGYQSLQLDCHAL